MSSPRGISLHIAVNIVDPEHYSGWDGALTSCENDADTMAGIASKQGFETQKIKTVAATRETVKKAIRDAAGQLSSGDLYLLTYSGHGGQVTDIDDDEEDGKDDTWCLYDGQLLDDEINVLLAEFNPGVRVLVLSDSCHSGTMLRSVNPSLPGQERVIDDFTISRLMPRQVAVSTDRKHRSRYTDIQNALPKPRPEIKASVKLLSGCREYEQSFCNAVTGRFTAAVKKVFDNGAFEGNYEQFHTGIKEAVAVAMNPQSPSTMDVGVPDADFDSEKPFTIK